MVTIFIFNGDSSSGDYGVMLAEVNVWHTGDMRWAGTIGWYDYNYNFRDPETGNRIAESGGVSDMCLRRQ